MSVTINILIPVALPVWWEEMAIRRYRIFASAGTEVIGSALSTAQQEAANRGELVEQLVMNAKDAERRAAFVHILDCFGDPRLDELQCRLDAPVVGVGQSTMLAASSWFGRFAVVTSEAGTENDIKEHVDQCGLGSKLTGSSSIGMAAADIPSQRAEAFSRVIEHATKLSEAGADAVLLGCTELAMMAEPLEEHLAAAGTRIRIVNPIAVSERWAEMTAIGCLHGRIVT